MRPKFIQKIIERMEPAVFISSAILVIGFVVFGGLFTDTASRVFGNIQTFIVNTFGWFYVLSASLILVFILYLLFSKFGDIRLGGDDARPEFSYFAWFTMLFSAGMGTGLVFWSVAEPINHYVNPPLSEVESAAALKESLQFTFFHWGLHPWAIYVLFGLALAYYHFRHNLPLAPRSMLYPLIGNHIYGIAGHVVDTIATVGTLFGVATSLGLGAMQINAGVSQLSEIPINTNVQILLIAGITAIATTSVVLGLKKGISKLSRFNIVLAIVLLLFVFVAGPTVYILKTFSTSLGNYLQQLVFTSFWVDVREGNTWQNDWTLFYWAWWISWSPFVGVFTARISKGRTVREFVCWVLLLPTFATFIWLSVFGGTGLHLQAVEGVNLYETIKDEVAISLHVMLNHLPWTSITSVLATLLITIFFITSSDSGSLVDDMVTSGGHPNPPTAQRIFWAVSEGTVAAILLLSGGLQALRTASLTSGLPMTVILLIAGYGLIKSFSIDEKEKGVPKKKNLVDKDIDI